MNLRIEGQLIRVRISKGELEQLCQGATLMQRTILPGHTVWEVMVVTETDCPAELHVSCAENNLRLAVAKEAAETLLFSLPSREGIEISQMLDGDDELHLALEVDIRSQRRNMVS